MKIRTTTMIIIVLATVLFASQTGCGSRRVEMYTHMQLAETIFPDSYAFMTLGGSCTAIINRGFDLDEGSGTSTMSLPMYVKEWRWTTLPAGAGEPEITYLGEEEGRIDYPHTAVAFKPEVPGEYTLVLVAECYDDDEVRTRSREITFEVVSREPIIKATTLLSREEGANYDENASQTPDFYQDPHHDFDGDGHMDTFVHSGGNGVSGPPQEFSICYGGGEGYQCEEFSEVELPEGVEYIESIVGGSLADDGSYLIYAKTNVGDLSYSISRFRVDVENAELVFFDSWANDMVYDITRPGLDIDGDGVPEFIRDDPGRSDTFFETVIDFIDESEPVEYRNAIALHRGTVLGWTDYDDDGYEEIIYKVGERVFVLSY